MEEFLKRMGQFVAFIKSAKLAPGFSEILIPGEHEYQMRDKRLQEGIVIDDETWRQLSNKAAELGVQL